MIQSEFQLHDTADDQQLAEYRPVSWLAVVSFVTGLLSAAAAVSTYFIWIPAIPILTGGLALWNMRRLDGRAAGAIFARIGLVLGALFLCIQLGQLVHSHHIAYAQARQFADGWLRLLADGHWGAADQATLPRAKRTLSATTVALAYAADPKLAKQWSEFTKEATACTSLIEWGPETRLRWVKNLRQRYLRDQCAVEMVYEAIPPGRSPVRLRIIVVRDAPNPPAHPATWWAKDLQIDDGSPPRI